MEKLKYKIGDTVDFAGKHYSIEFYKKNGFTGIEYDLRAMLPDKKTGMFEKCFGIPQGFLKK